MSTQFSPPRNTTAYLLGTCEFSFSLDATSRADAALKGYRDFGNLQAYTPATEGKKLEHWGSVRGKRVKDREANIEIKNDYKLKGDQWDYESLKLIYFGDDLGSQTQTIQTLATADTIAFTAGTPANLLNWYDIKVSGSRIRRATLINIGLSPQTAVTADNTTDLITHSAHGFLAGQPVIFTATVMPTGLTAGQVYYVITPLTNTYGVALTVGGAAINFSTNGTSVFDQPAAVEGTDFEVDLEIARVKFLTAQTASVYPTITAPAITIADPDYYKTFTPLAKATRKGYGRLIVFDQDSPNEIAFDHQDFACTLTIEPPSEVDGQKWTDWTITVSVTSDVGVYAVRRDMCNQFVP